MLHSTFVLLFRYWRCSDQIGQWIPITVVFVTSLHTCTNKGEICNRYNRSKFIEFKNSKMILGAPRLFPVYLPAISQNLCHSA
jgi:hypothetical protein